MFYFIIFFLNTIILISNSLILKRKLFFILIFFIILFITNYEIGGDYESQINRANYLFENKIFADPISYIATILQYMNVVNAPRFFGLINIIMLLVIAKILKINYLYLSIGLVFLYVYIITGYHRQSLSLLIFLISIYFVFDNNKKFGLPLLLFSCITHSWILFVLPLYTIKKSLSKNKFTLVIIISFIYLYDIHLELFELLSQINFFGHFIKNYLLFPMKSEGAIFRIIFSIVIYFIITTKSQIKENLIIFNNHDKFIYEELVPFTFAVNFTSITLFLFDYTTVADRILLINYIVYPIILYSYNNKIKSLLYYSLSLLYFIFWINLSERATVFW
jgi:hypothetical protein